MGLEIDHEGLLAVREWLEHALGDPPVRSQDEAAAPERLGRHPARRHVAIPLPEVARRRAGASRACHQDPPFPLLLE
jgi:hypothetical protein